MANENLNRAFQWGIDTCNSSGVRYPPEDGYRNQGIDPTTGRVCYDCSSFIWYALKNGGWTMPDAKPFRTPNMRSKLVQMGFTEFVFGSIASLPGDILWKSGHTEMVYEGSAAGVSAVRTMGAHGKNMPLNEQVSIIAAPQDKGWQYGYRWGSGGATGYGYSNNVIAAMCGNFIQESGINPERYETTGEGYGIGQWSFDRKRLLFEWLDNNGYSRTDGNAQCEYVLVENKWYPTLDPHGHPDLQSFLNDTTSSLSELVESWYYAWESPGSSDNTLPIRQQYAIEALAYMTEHLDDPDITDRNHQPQALSYAKALENAVMVYRYFSTGGGGGGGTTVRRKMPIWMMLRWKRGRQNKLRYI
ncbi:MAG: hypothetical protein IKY45_01560 [Clostridia bacterium]|nr:hypothetical protein [Clostridia bacterium]